MSGTAGSSESLSAVIHRVDLIAESVSETELSDWLLSLSDPTVSGPQPVKGKLQGCIKHILNLNYLYRFTHHCEHHVFVMFVFEKPGY